MSFVIDPHSESNLVGVHPDLVAVVRDCAANGVLPFWFGVTEGLRSLAQQKIDVAAGKSSTMHSRHLDGHAVDLVTIIAGKASWAWPPYHVLATQMKASAARLGIPIECGADWTQFPDAPHYQLPWDSYPSTMPAPPVTTDA